MEKLELRFQSDLNKSVRACDSSHTLFDLHVSVRVRSHALNDKAWTSITFQNITFMSSGALLVARAPATKKVLRRPAHTLEFTAHTYSLPIIFVSNLYFILHDCIFAMEHRTMAHSL